MLAGLSMKESSDAEVFIENIPLWYAALRPLYIINKQTKSINYFISANLKNKQKDPFWPGTAIAKCAFQLNFAMFTFLDNEILWFMNCQKIESWD